MSVKYPVNNSEPVRDEDKGDESTVNINNLLESPLWAKAQILEASENIGNDPRHFSRDSVYSDSEEEEESLSKIKTERQSMLAKINVHGLLKVYLPLIFHFSFHKMLKIVICQVNNFHFFRMTK